MRKRNLRLPEDDEDAPERLAERPLPDLLAVLDAVADVLRLLVDEQGDEEADQGERRRGVGEDGRDAQARADEIGHAPAGDRADVDDHVEDAEGQRGPRARRLLDGAGDAGLDDRAAEADEDDAQDDRDGEVDRFGRALADEPGPEPLDVAHDEVAERDEDEGHGQGPLEAELVGQRARQDGHEVDDAPEEGAVEEGGELRAHPQRFLQVDDHEGGHGIVGGPLEELDGVGRPERGREFRLDGRLIGHAGVPPSGRTVRVI